MHHIAYTSRVAKHLTSAELTALCEGSSRYNQRSGITGLLVYDETRFMQMIEGDEVAIKELMTRISADYRHHSVTYVVNESIKIRELEGWSLKCVGFGGVSNYVEFTADVKLAVRNMTDMHMAAAFIGFARLAH